MRVISKFHDYYDTVQAYGFDSNVVYLRKHESSRFVAVRGSRVWYNELDRTAGAIELPEAHKALVPVMDLMREYLHFHIGYSLSPAIFVIAGKLYPCLIVSDGPNHTTLFDSQAATAAYQKERFYFEAKQIERTLKQFFALTGDERFLQAMQTARLPLGLVHGNTIHTDMPLKPYHFQKVLPPQTLMQELSMFMANIGNPEKELVQIGDKHRIEAHGFDKHSFRSSVRA